MSVILGRGDFKFEAPDKWQKLPEGVRIIETPGVAVNSNDQVHAITRNPENPMRPPTELPSLSKLRMMS